MSFKNYLSKVGKFLASLRLAVLIIAGMAILASIGTFIESQYDAEAAKKVVYSSFWMYLIFGFLTINLIAVMVDRWPWKIHHLPFIFAHVGIIMIIIGSILTLKYGLDGSMRIPIGGKSQQVTVSEHEIRVWATFDGDNIREIYQSEVDFFKNPPKEKPVSISTDSVPIEIIDYVRYVLPRREVVKAEGDPYGAGLRFQFYNAQANVMEWLVQSQSQKKVSQTMGPAKVYLGPFQEMELKSGHGANEVYFIPRNDGVDYVVFHRDKNTPVVRGHLVEGQEFEPGWMGFKVRLLRYFPRAKEQWDIKPMPRPTPLTTPALRVRFGKDEHWVLLNDMVKLFGSQSAYILTFGNRKVDIGIPIELLDFRMERYPGTMRAASYQSQVRVPNLGERLISMNEPLYHQGLKFFQASFQQDEMGKAVASVLSVNYDPGRYWKYLGSLIMTLGIILLFYFKKYIRSKPKVREADNDGR